MSLGRRKVQRSLPLRGGRFFPTATCSRQQEAFNSQQRTRLQAAATEPLPRQQCCQSHLFGSNRRAQGLDLRNNVLWEHGECWVFVAGAKFEPGHEFLIVDHWRVLEQQHQVEDQQHHHGQQRQQGHSQVVRRYSSSSSGGGGGGGGGGSGCSSNGCNLALSPLFSASVWSMTSCLR